MKKRFLLIIVFLFSIQIVFATKDQYVKALKEIQKMLSGETTLDFKRAVFLTENAYLECALNYQQFCSQISVITDTLKKYVREKQIGKYKTAFHYAIFSYMTEATHINNFQICKYDFDDFFGDNDWTKMFVTKLLRAKTGNCHSLPYFFKILAEELHIKAFLAIAPNHVYIKHITEEGQWVNLELTNGHPSSDAWIISSMGISADAIKSGIYMDALTLKQSVALTLFDLAMGYQKKYGDDDFVLKCCNTALRYYPNCINALIAKENVFASLGKKLNAKNKGVITPESKRVYTEYIKIQKQIDSLGYKEMSKELYDEWLKNFDEEKAKQKTK